MSIEFKLELGRWRIEWAFTGGGMYLDAPLVGKVWIGPGGCCWDR